MVAMPHTVQLGGQVNRLQALTRPVNGQYLPMADFQVSCAPPVCQKDGAQPQAARAYSCAAIVMQAFAAFTVRPCV